MENPGRNRVNKQKKVKTEQLGMYLYCVSDKGKQTNLGKIGIEGSEVYTIHFKDLCAVVHDCAPKPYESKDEEVIKAWVRTHQHVIDIALEKFGTVLPLGFDTIIKGDNDIHPLENMKKWLKEEYDNLKIKMEKVRGKAEYGVQIFWNPRIVARNIIETNQVIKKLDEEIKSKTKGAAYMFRQKLESLLKKEMEVKADQCFQNFYLRIKKYADDIKVEKIKKVKEDEQMLMNLSCLVFGDKEKELGEELDKINKMEGFSVRFTGPWPPYSFA